MSTDMVFQVSLEYKGPWPETGPLRVEAHFTGEIAIAPAAARRRANGYLGTRVAMMIMAGEPTLVVGERPVWRVPACLHLGGLEDVATVGWVDVDATTGDVVPLSSDQIAVIQSRANAIVARLTSPTTSAS